MKYFYILVLTWHALNILNIGYMTRQGQVESMNTD